MKACHKYIQCKLTVMSTYVKKYLIFIQTVYKTDVTEQNTNNKLIAIIY